MSSLVNSFDCWNPINRELPSNTAYLNDFAIACLQDTQLIIKLAENQTIMAISKICSATRYIDQIILLIGGSNNDVLCLLVSIRTDLISAQTALIATLNMD